MLYETNSTEATIALGRALAPHLRSGDVILLDGDLGAGKTHFVKGLALGLGSEADVSSPTFAILNNYALSGGAPAGAAMLNHFDVYRVHEEEEILDLGFEEIVYGQDLSVIEWSSLIPGILPEDHLRILIRLGSEPNQRLISMQWSPTQGERSLPDADTGC